MAVAGQVVLCAYDGRPDLDDLPAPIDLLLRRSEDGGQSWSEQQVVRSGTGFEGFGDPSLLADPATGAVFLFHAAGQLAGFFESGDGEDPRDPHLQHCDVSVSHDQGSTWWHQRLTAQLRRSGNAHLTGRRIAGMFASSGAGCAITAGAFRGRLVQPFVLRIAGRIEVACALSDDHGQTWQLAPPIGMAASGTAADDTAQPAREETPGAETDGEAPCDRVELNESSVCMLPDGSLLLHSRGIGRRWAARSRDGGRTFTAPEPVADLLDPSVNGSVISAGGVLLASHCADESLRRAAVISRSDDGGASWRRWRTVEQGSAGYTQLAVLPGGRLGIAYEADGYQEIRFEDLGDPEPAGGAGGARGAGGEPAGSGELSTAGGASAQADEASAIRRASAEADAASATSSAARERGEISTARDASAEALCVGETGHETAAPGWARAVRGAVVLDVVLRSVVPARPDVWVEAGPTHEIDLDEFAGVDPAVFKEIGQGRGGAHVLRTRESLMANLGPIRPGIHAGDRLEVQARVRAEYEAAGDADAIASLHVRWADQERSLSPGESWLR